MNHLFICIGVLYIKASFYNSLQKQDLKRFYCVVQFKVYLHPTYLPSTYTVLHIFRQVLFCAGNYRNYQNFEKSLLTNKLWHVFMGMKHLKKKKSKWPTKKSLFPSSANSQYFFAKISWIGPLVSRIDWCEGHWCGSTYIVMRLSDISSKTGKKCIFCVFRLFLSLCRTASQPYRLSHTNALRINQFY